MAYVSQEDKKTLAVGIKKVLAKYGMKATIAIRHHSTLVVNISKGKLDIIGAAAKSCIENGDLERAEYASKLTHINVNHFWIDSNYRADQKVVNFLTELKSAMQGADWFDDTDIMTDYFHCSHYLDINVGKYNKPYIYAP